MSQQSVHAPGAVEEFSRSIVEGERQRIALLVAARLCDELNGEDIHEAAFNVYVARVGQDDGSDPSEDDYIEAFVAIANRAAVGDPPEARKESLRPGDVEVGTCFPPPERLPWEGDPPTSVGGPEDDKEEWRQ